MCDLVFLKQEGNSNSKLIIVAFEQNIWVKELWFLESDIKDIND